MSDSPARLPRWGRRKVDRVIQTEHSECGLACLAMVANFYGHDVDLPALRRRFGTSQNGVTIDRLREIAGTLDLDARAMRVEEVPALADLQLPLILHWEMSHFVVLERIGISWFGKSFALVHDPAGGSFKISLAELGKHFTGVALELVPRAEFRQIRDRRQVSLIRLTGQVYGLKRTVVQLMILAALIEFFALAAPMQMQWVVDNVIQPNDGDLLWVIAAAFVTFAAIQCGLSIMRGYVMTWIAATANAQWMRNLFAHLMRLPLEFFQKRSGADINSRFDSLKAIQTTLSGAFAQSALDGVMSIWALMFLAMYSHVLAGVAVTAAGVYAIARGISYSTLRRINEEELVYGAKQSGVVMESIKGMQAIKIANKQADRVARMANVATALAEREMLRQRATTTFSAINQCLFGIERILLVTLGAMLCLRSEVSVGMLLATLFYADLFNTRIAGLIDKAVEFRLLGTHGERIADIALEAPEDLGAHSITDIPSTRICVEGLGFRYSDSERWVFRDLSFAVEPGESVAIVGPSGCGKTTLAKLLLGLLEPTEGVIHIGGSPMQHWGKENYRRITAAVMQDEHLFSGTLSENISFFDPYASMERVEAAAKAAAIHAHIEEMPMRYESRIGEGGAGLSGGQKQRVLFARALYREPKILLLDEATSHLDTARESEINRAVRGLKCTRIVIAHRDQTIASAERRIELNNASATATASVRKRKIAG